MLIKLAWRNLWRQKRRTLITAGAIALALALSLFMRSMQEGSYSHNIDIAARTFTGMLQLQHPSYRDEESIDHLLPGNQAFIATAKADPAVSHLLPHLHSFALAAYGPRSKGTMVVGIDPDLEVDYSQLNQRVIQGNYLTAEALDQALVGARLADYLQLKVGDEVVLYGQGYRGQTAAGLFKVQGIIRFPMPALDAQIIYLPLQAAQQLYSTENQVTAWLLHTYSANALPELQSRLADHFGDQAAIVNWSELAPELEQQIILDRASGRFLIAVLYGVVGFGLLATLVMMTLERQREFAVMLATGLSRGRLQMMLALESLVLAALGVLIGLLIITPILIYFWFNPITLTGETAELILEMGYDPIIPFSLAPTLFMEQIEAVLIIVTLCLLYPQVIARRLSITNALKGG